MINIAHHLNDRHLHLILMPTEKCNFRCTYCYEDHHIGVNRQTINSVKSLLSYRIPELDSLLIEWFGGEPLLAKGVIVELSQYILNLINKYRNVQYIARMTTNAYLLNKTLFAKLVSMGISLFQITLDGPKDIHDKTRKLANNNGSYDVIWNNLLQIHRSTIPADILLRIHFSAETYMLIERLIIDIDKTFGTDPRFLIYFKAIERFGGEDDWRIESLNTDKKHQIINILENKIQHKNLLRKAHDSICYAASPNSMVIRANGDICRCTVWLDKLENKFGHLNKDGRLSINHNLLKHWFEGFETLDEEFLRCPARGIMSANQEND